MTVNLFVFVRNQALAILLASYCSFNSTFVIFIILSIPWYSVRSDCTFRVNKQTSNKIHILQRHHLRDVSKWGNANLRIALSMMDAVMRHLGMAKQTLGMLDAVMFQDGTDLEPTTRRPLFLSLEQGTGSPMT